MNAAPDNAIVHIQAEGDNVIPNNIIAPIQENLLGDGVGDRLIVNAAVVPNVQDIVNKPIVNVAAAPNQANHGANHNAVNRNPTYRVILCQKHLHVWYTNNKTEWLYPIGGWLIFCR
jgi:hypothetical protein